MILLYHLVFADSTPKETWNAGLVLRLADFRRQILWLKHRYQFLSLEDYLSSDAIYSEKPEKGIALTFDDGYRAVFELVAPFLEEEQVPATFFVNTSHLWDGELYWFVYFNALCSEKVYPSISINGQNYSLTQKQSSLKAWSKLIALARQSGDPIAFSKAFSKKYPLSEEVTNKYIGMTQEQILSIGKSNLFDVGGHTHTHPYLDLLSEDEQLSEMLVNKNILQDLTGNTVDHFAYTGGEYNNQSISAVKKAGFKAAFAIQPKNLGPENDFEIGRVGIYSPSIIKLGLKLKGLDQSLKNLIMRSGE